MSKKFLSITLIILSFCLISCSGGRFFSHEKLIDNLGIERIPFEEDYPEADAVVLYEVHDVELIIESDYSLSTVETVYKAVKLFKNIEKYAFHEIYVSDSQKLRDIKAQTLKPDGTVVEIPTEEFYHSKGETEGSSFYSDDEKVKFTFPSIEKGCIISYSYQKYNRFPFRRDSWLMQDYIPILRNQYRLTVPTLLVLPEARGGAGWDWKYFSPNRELKEPEVINHMNPSGSKLTKKVTFEWLLKDIPAFEPDPSMPPHNDYLHYTRFAPSDWKEWNDITDWYWNKIYKSQLVVTDKLKEKAKEITKNCNTELEKIKAVYKYIQKNFRYVAIDLNNGGIKPSTPQSVIDHLYGDCKDLSTLMYVLLKEVGVNAHPVLCRTANYGQIHKDFPCWSFNHMIVKVVPEDGKPIWIDPTVKHCSLGEIPWQCEAIRVLTLNEDGTGNMEVTPCSKYNDNVSFVNVNVSILDDLSAKFSLELSYKGERNISKRYYFEDQTEKDIKEYCQDFIADDFVNATIDTFYYSEIDSVDQPFKFHFDVTVPNAVQKQGDLFFLNIDPYKLFTNLSWLSKEERKYPLDLDYQKSFYKNIRVNIDTSRYQVRNLPEIVSESEGEIQYSKKYSVVENSQIVMQEVYKLKKFYITPERYKYFKKVFENIQKHSGDKIILTKK